MPQIIPTIEEYVATIRKENTIFMVFNISYNDKHAFKKKFDSLDSILHYLDANNTDYEAQKEFLDFMRENFPETKLQEVFDLVSPTYLQWSFLGSYAIDTSINGKIHIALEKKYENEDGTPKSNKAVLWELPYENAVQFHKKRVEAIEAEFGEEG